MTRIAPSLESGIIVRDAAEADMSVIQIIAILGDSGNAASIKLHERLGFSRIGTLEAVGFKLGQWVDTALTQRTLGVGREPLPDSNGDADAGA